MGNVYDIKTGHEIERPTFEDPSEAIPAVRVRDLPTDEISSMALDIILEQHTRLNSEGLRICNDPNDTDYIKLREIEEYLKSLLPPWEVNMVNARSIDAIKRINREKIKLRKE